MKADRSQRFLTRDDHPGFFLLNLKRAEVGFLKKIERINKGAITAGDAGGRRKDLPEGLTVLK
jgi:hypothetical protein